MLEPFAISQVIYRKTAGINLTNSDRIIPDMVILSVYEIFIYKYVVKTLAQITYGIVEFHNTRFSSVWISVYFYYSQYYFGEPI